MKRLIFTVLASIIFSVFCYSFVLASSIDVNFDHADVFINSPFIITNCQTISIPLNNTSKIEFINAAYGEPTIIGDGQASVFSDMASEHGGSNYYEGGLQITSTDTITFTADDWITATVSSDSTGLDGGNYWRIYYTDSSYDYFLQDSAPPGNSLPGHDNDVYAIQPDAGKAFSYFSASWARPWWSDKTTSEIQYNNIDFYYCTEEEFFPLSCTTVEDFHFTGAITDAWMLSGSASISNSLLSIPASDAAAQNLSTLNSSTTYNAVFSITNVLTTQINTLTVVLGIDVQQIAITDTGYYTTSFTTTVLIGPVGYGFQNDSVTGTIEIDYTCLFLAETGPGGEQYTCVAPPNGTFDSASDWDWNQGAAFNEASNAAFIPFNDVETHSDPFYTPAYITTQAPFTLPTLSGGEYLLISFDAKSSNNQNGLLTNWLQNTSPPDIDYDFTFEVYPRLYTFEGDISLLANEETVLLFGNDGGYPPTVTYEADISLDNVCIFIADRPPNLPSPTDPYAYTPVQIGDWYSCSDIVGILVNWGVDIRYHRINYENIPSLWEPQDWVPWLISAFWVMVETYLCIFFVAVKTLINLIERIINEGLNYGNWFVANSHLFMLWFRSWLIWLWESSKNFVSFLQDTSGNWLVWLALALIGFSLVPGDIINNLFILALWVAAGFIWVGSLFIPLLIFLLAEGDNVLRGLLNILIEDGWNAFIAALGSAISSIIEVGVGIWNNSLQPFLQWLLSILFNPLLLVLFAIFQVFWSLFWAIVMYLWENVFQTINIPFAFYTGFSDGVQSGAFSNLASCDGTITNFWCGLFSGLDLLNGLAGHTIFYPILIVGIVIATIIILYKNIGALWTFFSDFIVKI